MAETYEYAGKQIQIGDFYDIMITGETGRFLGEIVRWDEQKNAPVIQVIATSDKTKWPELKDGDYILMKKAEQQSRPA